MGANQYGPYGSGKSKNSKGFAKTWAGAQLKANKKRDKAEAKARKLAFN